MIFWMDSMTIQGGNFLLLLENCHQNEKIVVKAYAQQLEMEVKKEDDVDCKTSIFMGKRSREEKVSMDIKEGMLLERDLWERLLPSIYV